MAVYVVTGKLGAGKTLVAVGKIRDYLKSGCKVASNLDIDLNAMLGPKNKDAIYYRIPDKPSLEDLEFIGVGNNTNDEKKNGLLVLDECGTWFNSRSWADKARQGVINWFLHARKLGWDIIFLIQDLSIMDKQARVALAEHVVYCRRTDRIPIPIFGGILKLIWGDRVPMPKFHIAIVRYGDERTSLIVDKWIYRGRDLYVAYDTRQVFSDFYDSGVHQVLPPYLSHGRYIKPKGVDFYMRLTRIYFKRYSRIITGLIGLSIGAASAFSLDYFSNGLLRSEIESFNKSVTSSLPEKTFAYDFSDSRIVQYSALGNEYSYLITLSDGNSVSSSDLESEGYLLFPINRCSLSILTPELKNVKVYCH